MLPGVLGELAAQQARGLRVELHGVDLLARRSGSPPATSLPPAAPMISIRSGGVAERGERHRAVVVVEPGRATRGRRPTARSPSPRSRRGRGSVFCRGSGSASTRNSGLHSVAATCVSRPEALARLGDGSPVRHRPDGDDEQQHEHRPRPRHRSAPVSPRSVRIACDDEQQHAGRGDCGDRADPGDDRHDDEAGERGAGEVGEVQPVDVVRVGARTASRSPCRSAGS